LSDHFLARVPLFADLPPEDLDRLCGMVESVALPAGKTLFEEGSPGDRAYVIEQGEIEIIKRSGSREVLLAVRKSGEVIGEMSLLEATPRMATARARTDALLIAVEQQKLDELVRTSASAARAMFYTVLARWRATSTTLQQSERMAQLGTLTAGVAHELNNPAAAVKRGAEHLLGALETQESAWAAVHRLELDAAAGRRLAVAVVQIRERARHPAELDTMARADREEELDDWLDDHDISGDRDAGALVDLALSDERLEELLEAFGPARLPVVLRALTATYDTYNVVAEMSQGAERISSIVGALKQYSFLDQAPVQEVDLHEGLDNTLLILRSKLGKGVSVKREYDPALPRITARGSELNQVWTNLIDNAVDAMNGQGRILIRTCHEKGWVMVEIEDSGPGIPEDVQGRIFDAFFTTKPPGKGTGQGLAIAYQIVTQNHRGSIRVLSEPGRTRFQVTVPVNPTDCGAAPAALDPGNVETQSDAEVAILEATRTIAVVGMLADDLQPAHTVPLYLKEHGYRVIPVNPTIDEVLGERSRPDLRAVEEPVDTVLVFRRSEHVPAIVDDAIAIGAKAVWMQPGVIHEEAAERARAAGLRVVQDTCMRRAHQRYAATSAEPGDR
jgi:signal transduction histidine kinase/predicted CoA-binding protein